MLVNWVPSSSPLLARKSSALEDVLADATFLALLVFAAAFFAMVFLLDAAGDEFGVDRKLGGAQTHRFFRRRQIHAVNLEQDAARLHLGHPEFRRALARTHAHFGRLLGH